MPKSTLIKSENTLLKSPPEIAESPVVALIRSRQQLQADPENATALFEEAVALCRLGQWEAALTAWEQVTRLEPGNVFAYLNQGIAHLQREQWQQAEQAFEAALRYAPEHAEAHFGLGMAYAHQERYEQAYAAWQEALRFDPAHPEAHANLSMLAQMSTTEVESLNFGSAQTLQFDCIAGSEKPAQSEERRIKLPPLSGPPLGQIADAVVAAQEARAQEGDAAPASLFSDEPAVEERPEPTLKLDSKALKREHARLAAEDNPAPRQKPAAGWLRGPVAAVGMVIAAVILTLWGAGRFHAPAAPGSASHSTIVTPPNALSSVSTPVAMPPSVFPPVISPALAVKQPVMPATASAIRAHTRKTIRHAPASHRQEEAKPERHSLAKETSHPSRRVRESSVSAAPAPAPSRASTRNRQAHTDEDTFAAHRRAGHADNSEEWTDRMP